MIARLLLIFCYLHGKYINKLHTSFPPVHNAKLKPAMPQTRINFSHSFCIPWTVRKSLLDNYFSRSTPLWNILSRGCVVDQYNLKNVKYRFNCITSTYHELHILQTLLDPLFLESRDAVTFVPKKTVES